MKAPKDRILYVEGDVPVPENDEDVVVSDRRRATRMTKERAHRVARELRSRGFTVRIVHLVRRGGA